MFQDDYDYFPGFETYYSRNRHEYVYREGNAWVRRPTPRNVSIEDLARTPFVRLDFHDSPEKHHSAVVRSYPKGWARPDAARKDNGNRGDDKRGDGKDNDRKN
jgi:hypothetical protein